MARTGNRKLRLPNEVTFSLTETQLREAGRFLALAEGWNPDNKSCLGRFMWEVYAEQIQEKFLPAINHALGGTHERPEHTEPADA